MIELEIFGIGWSCKLLLDVNLNEFKCMQIKNVKEKIIEKMKLKASTVRNGLYYYELGKKILMKDENCIGDYFLNELNLYFDVPLEFEMTIASYSFPDYNIKCDYDLKIKEIKEMIIKDKHIHLTPDDYMLICMGNILEDDKPIKRYALAANKGVLLFVRKYK